MKKNNYILGLDLGITSVGFGIIEKESLEIVKYGVRLFEESNAENNLTRRTKRGQRRTLRRRQQRILEIKRLINKEIISNAEFKILQNIYELRVKGLDNKLTNNELANVLINIAKKRGSSLEVVIDETEKENVELASSLSKNTTILKEQNKFICELQLEKLKNNIKLKNQDNIYKTEDYIKELKQILSNQNLSDKINEKIISIIERRRHFSEGPGDENSPTVYGRFKGEYDEDGNKIIYNLIDLMRGKCSIYPDELCIAKNTFKACMFNLLNDLNNLTIVRDGEKCKISTNEKELILSKIVSTGKCSYSDLVKILNVDKEDISGFRIDKSSKPILTKFDVYEKFIKISKENSDISILNLDFVDETIEVLTKTQVFEERLSSVKNISKKLQLIITDDSLNSICNLVRINGYHSLSLMAIDEISNEMMVEPLNQQQIITKMALSKKGLTTGFNIEVDKKLILSPVAKRVQQEAIKVLNELRKTYGEFDTIMIETTRSKNSQEEKRSIDNIQKINEKNKIDAIALAQSNNVSSEKLNGKKRLKLFLYNQQNSKCIYTGNPINIDVLLSDDTAYEIEHIIPYSISFDNSLNNKALSESTANRLKGNNTPFYYFKSGQSYGVINNFNDYKTYVNSLNLSKVKKDNLLNEENINKFSNQRGFINRNLVDTSYGIRSFMNTISDHYKFNNIDTIVRTSKGKVTNNFRKIGQIDEDGIKNRNYLIHHAIDALIVAAIGSQKAVRNAYDVVETVNDETGEVLVNPIEDTKLRRFLAELKQINNSNIKNNHELFSYKVDTKVGRSVADETIYSTRIKDNEEVVVKKYNDIYSKHGESLTKLFRDNTAANKLLMYKNDIETFNIFQSVFDEYKDIKDKNNKQIANVFQYYKEITGFKIRKYSKKGNGPEITSIKYYDGKLGNHISITSNYKPNNKNVVLLQISPYRTDIYQNKDGLYKFLTIRRYHVQNNGKFSYIDESVYNELKTLKNIDENFEFKFSLNRNNIVKIVDENRDDYFRFIATNNELINVIECKTINCVAEKRTTPTIGKKTKLIEKYNVSATGKWKKVAKEDLKLKF